MLVPGRSLPKEANMRSGHEMDTFFFLTASNLRVRSLTEDGD